MPETFELTAQVTSCCFLCHGDVPVGTRGVLVVGRGIRHVECPKKEKGQDEDVGQVGGRRAAGPGQGRGEDNP